ncbi:MAG: hypothetical protein KKF27_21685 [Gammaproteobacteria bacterium]|nr:hypothetical protein [Gammaproteobacteria bacterium]
MTVTLTNKQYEQMRIMQSKYRMLVHIIQNHPQMGYDDVTSARYDLDCVIENKPEKADMDLSKFIVYPKR